MFTLKEKVILSLPILSLTFMVCAATYGSVPTKSVEEQLLVSKDAIYIRDKSNNSWRLTSNCKLDFRLSDNIRVQTESKTVERGSRLIITSKDAKKRCYVTSIAKT